MKRITAYLRARSKEPTTWRGLVFLLTSLGVALSPEQSAAIVSTGLAIAGGIGALVPDGER